MSCQQRSSSGGQIPIRGIVPVTWLTAVYYDSNHTELNIVTHLKPHIMRSKNKWEGKSFRHALSPLHGLTEFKSGKEKEKLAKHIFNMFHLSLQLHMLMEVKSFGKDHTLHSI